MSEHRTAEGRIYLLEWDPENTTCTHTDLAYEQATVPGAARYEATPLTADGFRTSPVIELLWYPALGRAGLACGGDADWTDAGSPAEALERYLGIADKEMAN